VVGFVGPSAFNVELSILFFFAVIVGGRGQPLGPMVGIVLIYLVPNMLLAEVVSFRLLIYGGIALLVMLVFPDGLIGSMERWRRHRRTTPAPFNLHVESVVQAGPAAIGRSTQSDAIVVRGGRRSFGRVTALDGVDLAVRSGEIHGLIGANGSGKTSLLNVLSGLSRLDGGSLRIRGIDTNRLSAHRIARLGLGRTFQTPRVFDSLSTWENLQIGLDARPAQAPPVPLEALARLGTALADHPVAFVPHGQRRLLEVMRVVFKGADVLLLDEPAAGLSVRERAEFSNLLRRLRDTYGKTIVLVEHDLDLVLNVADRITVLEAGRVVATGLPAEVVANPAVKSLFAGGVHE
jgi:branched-chain amino acid transport system permease protein